MKNVFVSLTMVFITFAVTASGQDQNQLKKIEQINIARLEALRADCLIKNSGNQRLCRRKVLKDCRSSMRRGECLSLMSKMQKSQMPKTNGPSPLQESAF